MPRTRPARIALGLAGLLALAAAVIAANFALLAYAQPGNDPVGKLSPRLEQTSTAPPPVSLPSADDDEGEGEQDADD